MKDIVLDFSEFMTYRQAHGYIARKMEFPDYYGNNLDALFECLTDIGSKVHVKIINCDMLDHIENALVNVFWDAQSENDMLTVEVKRRRMDDED